MIGLGSNRLSVCRRGGMSVTQAGRGGMEWLAGGRGASWASPYSAQATAALKAQFPTQWPTIRDYGFAHPEIVGYMNAYAPEDAKIAYSLVEGIGTRCIYGDGSGYFTTGLRMSDISRFELLCSLRVEDSFIIGTTAQTGLCQWSNSVLYTYSKGSYNNLGGYTGSDSQNTIVYTKTSLSINGVAKSAPKDYGNDDGYVTIGYSGIYNKAKNRYWEVKMDNHRFIPFKRNGQMELLDLVSGNLATRVGTFTELIETP